jgi:hypothetical protein
LALTLAASWPTGDPVVVALRHDIILHIGSHRAGNSPSTAFPMWQSSTSLLTHLPADSVYIGGGCGALSRNPSPWASPFGCGHGNSTLLKGSFSEYAYGRSDSALWLKPLVGEILICECLCCDEDGESHASVIATIISETFPKCSSVPPFVYPPVSEAPAFLSQVDLWEGSSVDYCGLSWDGAEVHIPSPRKIRWPD